MDYNSVVDSSPAKHAVFIEWLSTTTVIALKNARGNLPALQEAVQGYLLKATAASLAPEEIENLLGVNEPSIMDLAELSAEDEEIVIDTFEEFVNE
jgi:hypothetical protein